MGKVPVYGPQALVREEKVGSLQYDIDGVFVEVTMNGKTLAMQVSSGDIRTIVISGIVTGKLTSIKTSLRKATGKLATV